MTDQKPLEPGDTVRSGSRTLMLLGTHHKTPVWRDVTDQVTFANAKYKPHQGKAECARRLRQAARRRVIIHNAHLAAFAPV